MQDILQYSDIPASIHMLYASITVNPSLPHTIQEIAAVLFGTKKPDTPERRLREWLEPLEYARDVLYVYERLESQETVMRRCPSTTGHYAAIP